MGHSYLELRGRSLLVNDDDIVTVVAVVLDTMKRVKDGPVLTPGVHALLKAWEHLFDQYAPGCLDPRLNDFVRSRGDLAALKALLTFASERLAEHGGIVRGSYMNAIVDAPGVLEFGDRSTAQVQQSFDRFLHVLRNELSPEP